MNRRLQCRFSDQRLALRAPLQTRAAVGAGYRLSMKTSVARVAVLGLAARTEWKRSHRGKGAVIGHRANNGETRPTVSTVNKRVAIAALLRIVHLRQARRAGGRIGHNLGTHTSAAAFADGEILRRRTPVKRPGFHAVDTRQRRAAAGQRGEKRRLIAQQAHQYAVTVVTYVAAAS